MLCSAEVGISKVYISLTRNMDISTSFKYIQFECIERSIWSVWYLLKTLIPLAGSYLVCVCLAVFNFNVIGQVSLRDTTCALNIYLFNCSALFVKRKTLHIQGASEVRAYYVSVLGFC